GLPDNAAPVVAEAFGPVEEAAAAFASGAPAAQLETSDWTTHEWLHFLNSLPAELSGERMTALDEAFDFTHTRNSEVLFLWLRRSIQNRYEPAVPALQEFLTTVGRAKFVVPLYRTLVASEWGRPLATRIFNRARDGYHPITAN